MLVWRKQSAIFKPTILIKHKQIKVGFQSYVVWRKQSTIFKPTILIKHKQIQVEFQRYVGVSKAISDLQGCSVLSQVQPPARPETRLQIAPPFFQMVGQLRSWRSPRKHPAADHMAHTMLQLHSRPKHGSRPDPRISSFWNPNMFCLCIIRCLTWKSLVAFD